jgi:hypothetical protein
MKNNNMSLMKFRMLFSIFILIFLFTLGVNDIFAKSVSFTTGQTPSLVYYGDCGGGCSVISWILGLDSGVVVSGSYLASVFNNGAAINDGSSVPVGSTVSFNYQLPLPSWSGTGRTMDTPYGVWLSGAAAPTAADVSDFYIGEVQNSFFTAYTYSVYIPFSANPPTISYTHTGSTAGLNCNASGSSCLITSPGTILTQVNFSSTYGKFYYKYTSSAGSGFNYYNKVPMRSGGVSSCTMWGCTGSVDVTDYILNIPSKTINFSLTAVSNNNPPAAPTITAPVSANLGSTHTISFLATDPDNDTIRYDIDWNNDGVVDQYAPASGFVASNVSAGVNRTFPASGVNFTFRARTGDSKGAVSGWVSRTITLIPSVTGICGVANGQSLVTVPTIGLCSAGTASGISGNGQGSTPWSWSCMGSGGGVTASCSAVQSKCMVSTDSKYNQYGACANTCANGANVSTYPVCSIPGTWSAWSPCSVSCGSGGTQTRSCNVNIFSGMHHARMSPHYFFPNM